jgi:hypothetical protein
MGPETTKLILGLVSAVIIVGLIIWMFMSISNALSPKNIVSGVVGGVKQAGAEVIGIGKDIGKELKPIAKDVGKALKPVGVEIKKGALTVFKSKELKTVGKQFTPKTATKNVKKIGNSIKKLF